MVVCVRMLCCTVVGEDQCWEEHTVSEFSVEVIGLILEVGGNMSLVLAYQTTGQS
jgi:hypothetical protein